MPERSSSISKKTFKEYVSCCNSAFAIEEKAFEKLDFETHSSFVCRYFRSTEASPAKRHVYRLSIKDNNKKCITCEYKDGELYRIPAVAGTSETCVNQVKMKQKAFMFLLLAVKIWKVEQSLLKCLIKSPSKVLEPFYN